MSDFESEYLQGKSLEQLIDDLASGVAMPDSVVGRAYEAAIQAKIAERQVEVGSLQRDAAERAVTWAKWTAVGTIGATCIALAAFLVSVL